MKPVRMTALVIALGAALCLSACAMGDQPTAVEIMEAAMTATHPGDIALDDLTEIRDASCARITENNGRMYPTDVTVLECSFAWSRGDYVTAPDRRMKINMIKLDGHWVELDPNLFG